jgi:glycosyltransferase involved in cell wall biosynthesis
MNIAIDTLPHPGGGALRYFRNVLHRFADDGNEYLVLVPAGREELTHIEANNIEYYEVRFWSKNILTRLVFQQFGLPILLLLHDIDVLFSPGDVTSLLAPCDVVMMVQNPNPYYDVNLQRSRSEELKFAFQRVLTRISARKAKRIIFVSEHSRDSANRYLEIKEQKLEVIYHGVSDRFRTVRNREPTCKSKFEGEYILAVSTVLPHKNYELLLRGYAQLPMEIRHRFELIIAGRQPSDRYFEHLQELASELDIRENVRFLGEVSDETLLTLYARAEVFVLPSKLETFGLTLIEAMASGTPVIATDSTCIPEITDEAALLVDPSDPFELARTIEKLLSDKEYRNGLIEAGTERISKFSWNETAKQTRTVLEEVA